MIALSHTHLKKLQQKKLIEIIYSLDAHPEEHCSFSLQEIKLVIQPIVSKVTWRTNKPRNYKYRRKINYETHQIQQSVVFKACTADADSYMQYLIILVILIAIKTSW